MFRKLITDFLGLLRICGPALALRWLAYIPLNFAAIMKRRDLMVADAEMGDGPFSVKLERYHARFSIQGPHAVSGIREMYVRDHYLDGGWLSIPLHALVVDLGANMGNFTNLALAIHPDVQVVAVEPSSSLNASFQRSVSLNRGAKERTKLVRAFVGSPNPKIASVIENDPNYREVPWITEDALLAYLPNHSVDFLKCDIEGGEYALLTPQSELLKRTKNLACEVHGFAGDPPSFVAMLNQLGFTTKITCVGGDGTIVVLAKRAS